VLFLPPGQPDPQRFEGLGWGEVQTTSRERPFRILRWNEEEGPLAKSDEGLSLPLTYTVFERRQVITGQKSILAAFDDGTPFLARQTVGRGELFFCGSAPEAPWSNLGDGPVLVPMMQRLLQSGSRRLQQAMSATCGELSAVDQARRWEPVDSSTPKDVRTQAGVYRAGDRLLAVNRPRSEDDFELMETDQAKRLFGSLSLRTLEERGTASDRLQGEVWRIFLFSMLLFLVVEGILILPPAPAQQAIRGRGAVGAGSKPAEVGT
jgi:hypothetical protein